MPAAAARPEATTAPTFRWFLASLASWFAAFGLQGVLFSYLVVFFLAADHEASEARNQRNVGAVVASGRAAAAGMLPL